MTTPHNVLKRAIMLHEASQQYMIKIDIALNEFDALGQRYSFYIDVGNTPKGEVDKYLRKMKKDMKKAHGNRNKNLS